MLLLLLLLLSCRAPTIAWDTFEVGVAPTGFGEVSPLPSVGRGGPMAMVATAAGLLCERCFVERVPVLFCYIVHGFPADFVRCSAQGTWFRGRKVTILGISMGKTACTRVLGLQILASLKVLLVPVRSIDKREFVLASIRSFLKGYNSNDTTCIIILYYTCGMYICIYTMCTRVPALNTDGRTARNLEERVFSPRKKNQPSSNLLSRRSTKHLGRKPDLK